VSRYPCGEPSSDRYATGSVPPRKCCRNTSDVPAWARNCVRRPAWAWFPGCWANQSVISYRAGSGSPGAVHGMRSGRSASGPGLPTTTAPISPTRCSTAASGVAWPGPTVSRRPDLHERKLHTAPYHACHRRPARRFDCYQGVVSRSACPVQMDQDKKRSLCSL
jgi:hypothetical protein